MLLASAITLGALFAAGLGACSASSSTAVPPTTGILIRAETLTSGRGCGRNETQLFKYAVIVYQYSGGDAAARSSYGKVFTKNVFDCFSDGAFISLPSVDGNSTFRLEVFGYNEPSYETARAVVDAPVDPNGLATLPEGLRQTAPTWTTECTATQQPNVQALASCDPLAPGLSGLGGDAGATKITLATDRFDLPDGRVATCASDPVEDAGVDASDEGGTDAGADAGDAEAGAPPDAGAPITFAKVRVRPRVNATIAGPSVDLACPTPYLAEVAATPTRYDLDVALLDSAGNLVDTAAQTVCTVTSQPGTTSSAVCP